MRKSKKKAKKSNGPKATEKSKGTWYVSPGSLVVTVSDDDKKSTAVRFRAGIGFLKAGAPLEARMKKQMERKGIKGYSSLSEAEKAAGRPQKKKKISK